MYTTPTLAQAAWMIPLKDWSTHLPAVALALATYTSDDFDELYFQLKNLSAPEKESILTEVKMIDRDARIETLENRLLNINASAIDIATMNCGDRLLFAFKDKTCKIEDFSDDQLPDILGLMQHASVECLVHMKDTWFEVMTYAKSTGLFD